MFPILKSTHLTGGKAQREETFKVGEFSDPQRFLQENLHGSAPLFVLALHTQHLAAVQEPDLPKSSPGSKRDGFFQLLKPQVGNSAGIQQVRQAARFKRRLTVSN